MSKEKSAQGSEQRRKYELSARPDSFLVVGLGASAGGVQALQEFFQHVPADSGIAYVVILHLSPNHDSQLAAVLQQTSPIPVTQVTDRTLIRPNHVYVVPPDKHLLMEEHHITIVDNTLVEERRAPVDIFFRSLADTQFANAVGVVLSGTGANGSMGIKRIKERGGAAFVQNPREAEYAEMPRNSIATDLIDAVLPVAQIPDRIIAYRNSLGKVEIPVDEEVRAEEQQHALREIFTLLRTRTGHDFSNYKRATLMRRIERRINVRAMSSLLAYAEFMRDHPEETTALLKDLLISVTNFFRDEAPFAYIEETVLPALLQDKRVGDQLRIWVVACATGEEAYSLAMLCAELTEGVLEAPKVQIFATDIDEGAIAIARDGLYTINDAADVSPERLRRFFNREGEQYRIRREIREMILFAKHNVMRDPPFSHIDLVSCRNMLIYLNSVAQERVMETLHFALKPGGFLFLGSSESAGGASDLFMLQSQDNHLYRARHVQQRQYPVPDSTPSYHLPRNQQIEPPHQPAKLSSRFNVADLHLQLLEHYAPPSVVINAAYDVLHISERAGRYMQVSGGEPSQNLLKMIRPELRIELRTALIQAVQKQTNVDAMRLPVQLDDRTEAVNILVRPVLQQDTAGKDFILVLFEPAMPPDEDGEKPVYVSDEPAARHLEEELIRVKSQLRATIEQHEFGTEELKASNEELQAMNEEIRSSAEELETSKEELQSINEELSTVNQELKVKIEELSISTNNLQNLINSTNIGTIFLDRSFRLALFTPRARDVFNLIPADIGRPISDITSRLENTHLVQDADEVLQKLVTMEREVHTTDGIVYLMRISPYRTEDDRINGVVISFIDITERKKSEEARLFFAAIVESSEDTVISVDFDSIVTGWNTAAEKLYGYSAGEAIGKPLAALALPEDLVELLANANKAQPSRKPERYDTICINKDGQEINLDVVVSPVKDNAGAVIGVSTVARDVTERKRAEEAVRESHARTNEILESISDVFYTLDKDYVYTYVNRRAEEAWGRKAAEVIGKTMWQVFPEVAGSESEAMHRKAMDHRETVHYETFSTILHRWLAVGIFPTERGGVSVYFQDIEDRKKAEQALQESQAHLSAVFREAEVGLSEIAPEGKLLRVNDTICRMLGYTRDELLQLSVPDVTYKDDLPVTRQQLATLIESGTPVSFDKRYQRKDGSVLWANNTLSLVGINGKTPFILAVTVDLTQRMQAEAALRQSEARARTLADAVPHVLWTNAPDGTANYFNKRWFDYTGLSEQESMGPGWQAVVHPDDAQMSIERWKTALTKGDVFDTEYRLRRYDGAYRWFIGRNVPLRNKKGQVVGWFGSATDIHDQKQAQDAVRASEERLQVTMDSAIDYSIMTLDTAGLYTGWSAGAQRTFGYTEAEVIGRHTSLIFTPEDVATGAPEKEMMTAVADGYSPDERWHVRANGIRFYMSGVMRPIYNPDLSGFVKVARDMTQQKLLEQQKDEFIGIASHELKTPVTSIKAYAEVLEDMFAEAGDEQSAGLMQKMDKQVDRLTELIRTLLDVTRISQGQFEMNLERFEMADLIHEAREDMQRTTNHRLELDIKGVDGVVADRDRIRQVLVNFLSNAIKYSPDAASVVITATQDDPNYVSVCVEDFGIGIGMSEDVRSRVFERFYRASDGTITTYPGLGLGLYISAEIIRQHGGRIWVESEQGKGSKFCFDLPTRLHV